MVNEKNIARVSFVSAILLVSLMILSIGGLLIANKINSLGIEIQTLEDDFVKRQKIILKDNVENLISIIDSSQLLFYGELKEQLRQRVEEALAVAANLYKIGGVDREQCEVYIREALRPVRFHDNQSYYFILTMDGVSVLHPTDPIEGRNLLQSDRSNTSSVVSRFVEAARREESGYIEYQWSKPGEASVQLFPKISYYATFKPLNWIIATGEYIDNLNTLTRESITHNFRNHLRTATNNYYFIYKLHNINGGQDFATMLINSNRKDLEGEKLSDDYPDAKGKLFRREFLEGIRKTGEAYVVYWYKKPDGSGVGRKLAYFKHYKEWDWVVSKGIYFDQIDAAIVSQKERLRKRVYHDIFLVCVIFVFGVIAALLAAFFFSRKLEKIFYRYQRKQQEHAVELEELNEVLTLQSRTDRLTGVANKGYFNELLIGEASRVSRYGSSLSVILYDIDYFKRVNDTFGHLQGDVVLKEITQLIGANIRISDTLARWGGEEFVILAPGLSLDEACQLAEKLCRLVADFSFSVDMKITSSFGVAVYLPPEDAMIFLGRADDNLYKAKEQGRNRCVCA